MVPKVLAFCDRPRLPQGPQRAGLVPPVATLPELEPELALLRLVLLRLAGQGSRLSLTLPKRCWS